MSKLLVAALVAAGIALLCLIAYQTGVGEGYRAGYDCGRAKGVEYGRRTPWQCHDCGGWFDEPWIDPEFWRDRDYSHQLYCPHCGSLDIGIPAEDCIGDGRKPQ